MRWVEVYAQLTLNPDGSVLGTSGSLTDITERKRSEAESQNVLAILPGTDPVMKGESVVFSAHLDHLGVGEPVGLAVVPLVPGRLV